MNLRAIERLIFFACLLAFGWFNQGGGWNQNARFAEVRAIVEQGRFAIDDYLLYQRGADGKFVRVPLERGSFVWEEKRQRLAWTDSVWTMQSVDPAPLAPGEELTAMVELVASGDVGYVPQTGHFHPNKPPGTTFLAVPGYWLIFQIERLLGINPDHYWTLSINAWLTTVLSTGLLAALGCVIFFRLACKLGSGGIGASPMKVVEQTPSSVSKEAGNPAGSLTGEGARATTSIGGGAYATTDIGEAPMPPLRALAATLCFAFGTTFFPFATVLFDHAITATLLLGCFACLLAAKDAAPDRQRWLWLGAGLFAGYGAVCNNLLALTGAMLGVYALWPGRGPIRWRACLWFPLGVLPPFLLICWYGWTCFGTPFALNTDLQNPMFKDDGGAFLGMFKLPNLYVAQLITFTPQRGFLYLSPVLALAFVGLWRWWRGRELRAEAVVCAGMFGFFWFVNICFNGFNAGFSSGPRYLVPGLPFLALPLVAALGCRAWLSWLLALISIGNHWLLTATDACSPAGVGGHTRLEGVRAEWDYALVGDYALPLFLKNRAWPLLDDLLEVHMVKHSGPMLRAAANPADAERAIADYRAELRDGIARGDAKPFLLSTIEGPVSTNPMGVWDGLLTYRLTPPTSDECRWASFNAGELLLPRSRWSLVPVLLGVGALLLAAHRKIRRA